MKDNSLKKVFITYLFICFLFILVFLTLKNIEVTNLNWPVMLIFFVNGVIIFLELMKSSSLGYSLKDTLIIFMFIFMWFSPIVQYLSDEFPWWNTELLTDQVILHANALILLFLLTYLIVYYSIKSRKYGRQTIRGIKDKNVSLILHVMFILTLICSLYVIANTGLVNLFSRSTNVLNIDSSSIMLIVNNSFKSVSVFYVALNILYYKKKKKVYKVIPFFIGTLLMLLVNFPTGSARFWMASVYLGLLLLIFPKVKNQHAFKIVMLVGMFVIFPLINIFRRNTWLDISNFKLQIPNPSVAFLSGDFDSFSMLARSIVYVGLNGISNGYQLLGNIFFFIPRNIWSTKPVGSGYTVAQGLGWDFKNVSMSIIGEGYLNFGVIGVILFAFLLAIITSSSDCKMQKVKSSNSTIISYVELVYPFSIGFLFFILRGDLLSSFSYYIGFLVPFLIIYIIDKMLHY